MEAWRQELYLAHHGVLGQKWGVRRYQNEDGTLTAAGRKRRSALVRVAKGMAIRAGSRVESVARTIEDVHRTKGIGKKIDALVGDRAAERNKRLSSETHKKLADNADGTSRLSKLTKAYHEQHSANDRYLADLHKTRQSWSKGKKMVDRLFGSNERWNTPYRTLAGRTTTRGRKALDLVLTGGAAGFVSDLSYLSEKKHSN